MLTNFHNYFTVRLTDNFATKVIVKDQSYRNGFGGLVFLLDCVTMSHIFILLCSHSVGELSTE